MLTWLWRIFWIFYAPKLRQRASRSFRRRGLLVYLRTLDTTRRMLIVVLLASFAFHLFLLSAIGAVITGVLLLNKDSNAGLEILFGAFAGIFFAGLVGATILLSSRLWFKASGAKSMMEEQEDRAA